MLANDCTPGALHREIKHPCIVDGAPTWEPLSRAQILMMAIQLRRIRRMTQQPWSNAEQES